MPVVPFTALTLVGSLPWTFAFALAGEALAANWQSVANAFTPISIVVGVLLVAWVAWWLLRRARMSRGSELA
jgi:membrane protein DedA with SNARE-associated domain